MMEQTGTLAATYGRGSAFQGHVEWTARQRLSEACPHAFYFERISLDYADGILTLRGQLPSFHLKQMLQEHLRGMESVTQIDNQVDVVGLGDLSVGRAM
jgi:hypothetical protein